MDLSNSIWEERIGPAELERAVLSLLEFGQISAARQLQHKLSPSHFPSKFVLVDAALKLAAISTPSNKVVVSMLKPRSQVAAAKTSSCCSHCTFYGGSGNSWCHCDNRPELPILNAWTWILIYLPWNCVYNVCSVVQIK
ncbi:uncharacterized protein [Rutidosis leptorrhynchoides]|uniref:uncharacterized protein isoform X2 n=1 Tax=Rutidosis leptorrhynchoides TaxID=125765 RepID=UPI003A9A474F